MKKSVYSEKLKDPRWQKKRLEILQRDGFACQICGDPESTLHVHHRRYIRGAEPWEYPNQVLVTLCESCHTEETQTLDGIIHALNEVVRDFYFSSDIIHIAEGIKAFAELCAKPSEVQASIFADMLSNRDFVDRMDSEFFAGLKRAKDIGNG